VTLFKIRKNSRFLRNFFTFVKIHINSFYRITVNCKVFEFAQH